MFNKKDKIIDVTSDSVDADPEDAQEMKRREDFVNFIQKRAFPIPIPLKSPLKNSEQIRFIMILNIRAVWWVSELPPKTILLNVWGKSSPI